MTLLPQGGKPKKESWFFSKHPHWRQEPRDAHYKAPLLRHDVHKETVLVCVLPPDGTNGKAIQKTYKTFEQNLIRLRVWLKQLRVTHIALESTGVYWIPVWNLLEDPVFEHCCRNELGTGFGTRIMIWVWNCFCLADN